MKKLLVITLVFCLAFVGCTVPSDANGETTSATTTAVESGAIDTVALADYLPPLTKDIILKIDKRFNSSYLDYDIVQENAPEHLRIKTIAETVEDMPINEQYMTMYQAFYQFNDAHTNFIVRDLYYSGMPIIFERIDDAFVIINATKPYRDMIGQTIQSIDGVSIDEWYKRAYAMATADNDYGRARDAVDMLHGTIPYTLYNNALKYEFEVVTDKGATQVQLDAFASDKSFLKNDDNYLRLGSYTTPMFSAFDRDPYGYRLDDANKIIFIYFNTMSGFESKDLIEFGQSVRAMIEDKVDYSVVFDFRTCLGGSIGTLPTIFEVRFLKKIQNRAFTFVARNSLSAGTTTPAVFRRLGGIPVIGEMSPYSEYTSGVSSTADNFDVKGVNIDVRMSQSNGYYKKRLNDPALVPDYEVKPTYKDFTGERDSWVDMLLANR